MTASAVNAMDVEGCPCAHTSQHTCIYKYASVSASSHSQFHKFTTAPLNSESFTAGEKRGSLSSSLQCSVPCPESRRAHE
jgi:hypothetical protein